jgi:CheY-like chemotaxis protein
VRILIVDDNESLRRLLSSLFVNVGHEVVSMVANGSQQVEAEIQRTQPDIVCLDYNLPGRDGLTILHAIQSMAPQIDVLFMTGSNETDLEQRAADAGASGFIRKPFGQAQIVRELSNVCETRKYAPRAANQIPTSANSASPKAVSQNNDSPRGRRGKAVIADDSAAIRLVLKGLLEECGLQVVQSVANGADAVKAAQTHQPEVLCLDVNMPGMSGLEALPLIRANSPKTAVVMVTGSAEKSMVAEAASHGASGYIVKPLRPAHVISYMDHLFKQPKP